MCAYLYQGEKKNEISDLCGWGSSLPSVSSTLTLHLTAQECRIALGSLVAKKNKPLCKIYFYSLGAVELIRSAGVLCVAYLVCSDLAWRGGERCCEKGN